MTTRDLSKMKKNGNPQISAEVTQEFPKVTRGRREMKGTCWSYQKKKKKICFGKYLSLPQELVEKKKRKKEKRVYLLAQE